MKLKHGAYVFFVLNKKKRKGRISMVENGRFYLCQDCLTNILNDGVDRFGHESAYGLGNSDCDYNYYIRNFSITPATKKAWTAFKEIPDKTVAGWGFAKEKGRSKNPTYVFGCGAVKVTHSQIKAFINERDEYVKLVNTRQETVNKLHELQKKLIDDGHALNKWQTTHSESMAVVNALATRAIKPERINTERLKLLFK